MGLQRMLLESCGFSKVWDAAMPAKLASAGLQVAGGVPLMLGEAPLTTFRVGLFGLDKLKDVAGTVARLEAGVAAALRGKGGEL